VGFANYIVPLQIGARDMAFPRLNAMSFWMFLCGGLVLYSSFVLGGASNAGYHYLGCAKTFALMGKAFADANLAMMKGR